MVAGNRRDGGGGGRTGRGPGNRWRFTLAGLALLLAGWPAVAGELHVGTGQTYATIQAALDAAQSGDIVTVHPGTYYETPVINLPLLLQGAPGEEKPRIVGNYDDSTLYSSVVRVRASDVTLRSLDISNADERYGYGVGDASNVANLKVVDCRVHSSRHGIVSIGTNPTVVDSEISHFLHSGISVYGAGPAQITDNWIHSARWRYHADSGDNTYGIVFRNPAANSGTSVVAYNYLSGTRTGIAYVANAENPQNPASRLEIRHNTIDGSFDLNTNLNPWGVNAYIRSGIDLFALGSVSVNASNLVIRDNLIVECPWYAMYAGADQSRGLGSADLLVSNSLFHNNFWFNPWWDTARFAEEFPAGIPPEAGPGSRAQVGWLADDDPNDSYYIGDFLFENTVLADPLLLRLGNTPGEYYSLLASSPGWGTASDGTHIGAWQLQIIPEPATALLVLLMLGLACRRP